MKLALLAVSTHRPKKFNPDRNKILTNILINALSARQGGGQTYVKNLLDNVADRSGLTVFIVAPRSFILPEIVGKIVRVPTSHNMTTNPYLRVLWERIALPRLLRRLKIDLLFCPGGSVGYGIPASCKIATTFQNMMPFDLKQRQKYPFGMMRIRNWLLERVLLSGMMRSDLVIFISEYAKSVIHARSGNKLIESVIIPHGINQSFRRGAHALTKPDWLPSGPYLLYVSTLDVYKAQLEVVKAYSYFKASHGNAPKLVLVGPEYAPYAREVRMYIASHGLTDDVILLGNVPHMDLPAAYQNALVNIFASETENCPFILLEALGSGRPMLVSSRPPMPEFAGDSVIYFDPSEPDDLAEKLSALLIDTPLMEQLSERALEQSLKFQWEATGRATWNALETVGRLTRRVTPNSTR